VSILHARTRRRGRYGESFGLGLIARTPLSTSAILVQKSF